MLMNELLLLPTLIAGSKVGTVAVDSNAMRFQANASYLPDKMPLWKQRRG